jgi:hypothetical protein
MARLLGSLRFASPKFAGLRTAVPLVSLPRRSKKIRELRGTFNNGADKYVFVHATAAKAAGIPLGPKATA